ncbi:type II secretion system protein [Thiohalorhabdus sp.]|uniref:type II secretion system protein n=1 Tax=Thiohalorhabdus sp. TaxID=3094134 RepID=UPI002FC36977
MAPEARDSREAPGAACQRGLTLIELVVTIVVIGIAASAVMLMLAQGFRGSVDPQLRIKAVELGQSYMDEIFSKPWDEKSPRGGGCVRPSGATNCGSGPNAVCPGTGDCGPDAGEGRGTFDDVDDYQNLEEGSACGYGADLRDASGNTRRGRYDGFCVAVTVATGVGGELQDVAADDAKRIDIAVTGPRDLTTTFTAYRLNF